MLLKFINPQLADVVPKERYEIFAGADWPSYDNFINREPIYNESIEDEILKFVNDSKVVYRRNLLRQIFQRKGNIQSIYTPLTFLIQLVLPGIVGTGIYFYLGGTWTKLFALFAVFYVINFLYNFSIHRWLSHFQVDPKTPVKYFLLWITTTIGCYRNISWVATHRCHHQYPDTKWDPYPACFGPAKLIMNIHHGIHPYWAQLNSLGDTALDFVDRHYFKLYFLNLVVFALIDIDIVLLSFAFLRLYTFIIHGYSSWEFHQGKLDGVPDNIPIYFEFLFGGDALHKEHHDNPKKFNCSIPGRIDPAYYLMRWIAKKPR